ncbi:MAG: ribonucleoside reductase class II [Firmicutes bacterium]|nr:ribonucleoside reductase class II [Bacillota bacterium]
MRLSENARTVLERRYLRKEGGEVVETPEEMLRRVADNIAAVEGRSFGKSPREVAALAEEFYRLMDELKFLPNSPTLMNAGRELQQLAACFVLPIEDSLESIFETLKIAALIHKSGGGTGFSFSRLRPKNDRVGTTGGVASGPVSFLKVYNASTEAVKQGGTRRGANMGILRVDHPDILEFIDLKRTPGVVTNFNLSVAVTDAFMEAVAKGEDYYLINPRSGSPVERLSAREVFGRIVEAAWAAGEPGVVFIDRINAANPTPHLGAIESTNPCVTGDTWISTAMGPRQVKELVGKPFIALGDGRPYATGEEGFFKTGTRPVVRLATCEGYSLRLTPDHLVARATGQTSDRPTAEWVPAKDLRPGDRILLHDHRALAGWPGELTEGEGYLLGLLVGDGVLKKDVAVLSVWAKKEAVNGPPAAMMQSALAYAMALPHRADFQGWVPVAGRCEYRLKSVALRALAARMGIRPGAKTITPALERASSEGYRGFLRGLFDCDGSVQGSQAKGVSIHLAQSDLEFLQAVQRMLLRLGIASVIYSERRPAGEKLLPDGKGGRRRYPVKAQHELVITGENLALFHERVGFGDPEKAAKLRALLAAYRRRPNRETFTATVMSITDDGVEEVYDVRVPGVNAFDANGFYVHNCGEQPLLPYEACNLGSINLSLMVKNGQVDWEELRRVVHLAVRFLDDVIEATVYPLPKIEAMAKGNRKIGLGVMGWAEMLIQLGIAYDSEPAIELAREVMGFIDRESKEASARLAEERGPFPNFHGSIYDRPGGVPLRNAPTTTLATTGTLSIIADTTGGIEPIFSVAFTRQILDGERLIQVNSLFARLAQERGFHSKEILAAIAEKGTVRGIPGVPEDLQRLFVTAHEIAPEWHVRMQAAFQEHTDNAVSKTVNFPREATPADVEKVYHLAFALGCKGVTVYRDGSIQDQPMQKGLEKPKQESITLKAEPERYRVGEWGKIQPVHRPTRLHGITDVRRTPEGNLYLTLNFDEGHPFELFAQIGKAGSDISAFTEAIARLISLAFRCGVDPEAVAEQLVGIGGSRSIGFGPQRVRSVPDAIGRFLYEYLYNPAREKETAATQGKLALEEKTEGVPSRVSFDLCPVCGIQAFGYVEGCAKCLACGHAEC